MLRDGRDLLKAKERSEDGDSYELDDGKEHAVLYYRVWCLLWSGLSGLLEGSCSLKGE